MPTGIELSVMASAVLSQRGAPEADQATQRSRDTASAAATDSPQAVLATGGQTLLRAPDPETGSQSAENQLAAGAADTSRSSGGEPAGGQPPPQSAAAPSGLQALVGSGIGGNVDLTV